MRSGDRTRPRFWVAAVLGLVGLGAANPQAATGAPRVTDIRVEGLRRVESEAALSRVQIKVGDVFDPKTASQALHQVWETELFRDVRLEREVMASGIRLVFVVTEKPSIKEVKYEGNDSLSEDDIKAVVDVKPFTILKVNELKKNVEKIRDLCVEKGFYLAEVAYRIDKIDGNDNEVNVVFTVVENAKVMVKQLTFIGNKHLKDEQIKDVLQTREGSELSFLSQSGTYKEEFFQTDLFRIQALYYDHGFVNIKVGQPTATISSDRRYIFLSAPIEEGEQYNIGEVKFSGDVTLKADDGSVKIDEAEVRSKLTIRAGEIFNRTQLFQDIQSITDVYRDQGYAYANVTPNSAIRNDVKAVDLDLEVERGDVIYFERLEVVGNTRTRDKVIRREMRIFEGDRYSATNLNESKARVYQLGFFETVNISTSRGSKPNLMNVTIEVKEKSTGTFQIGAGFSSVESFIATAQIAQNNFLGNGQLLSVSAQLSFGDFARQLATVQFYEPYFLDSEWSFGMNAYITQRYYREFQRNANGLSPSFGYPITPDLRVNAGYTLEFVRVETDPASGKAFADLTRGNGRNSSVNASVAYDTRDNRLFPSKGHFHTISAEVSDRALGAEDGLENRRLQLYLRYYYPLPLSLVLKLNAEFGVVSARGGRRVAIAERFFPGGIYSVRGFEPRGLGPTEKVANKGDPSSPTSDFIVGGNKQTIFNLEIEFPIIEQAGIKGVVFADAGNAYNDDEGFFYLGTPRKLRPPAFMMRSDRRVDPPLGLYYAFGFGFRWFSPIGPLRFEWGIPITKRNVTDRGIIFEFTIGNFF
ncbi:MAG: outer membrane protein assembly factor BamA [Deltaproteobacteria bacterium]|nr:outer membrane protein assembly factor BamA [Deltaproteobacteria bacterium]